jgi:hypothetical protein
VSRYSAIVSICPRLSRWCSGGKTLRKVKTPNRDGFISRHPDKHYNKLR